MRVGLFGKCHAKRAEAARAIGGGVGNIAGSRDACTCDSLLSDGQMIAALVEAVD